MVTTLYIFILDAQGLAIVVLWDFWYLFYSLSLRLSNTSMTVILPRHVSVSTSLLVLEQHSY